MEKCFQITGGGVRVACRLSEPRQVNRIVLGVHGFSGSAEDEIQAGIAEEMVMFRSAVLRFDFPAHGQSPVEELTLAVDQLTILYNNKDTFLVVQQVEVSYSVRELKHPQKY